MGKVTARREGGGGATFSVAATDLAGRLSPGDSLAVNGVCLTVERVSGDQVSLTAVGETLRLTTLGGIRTGSAVNLEPAATPDTALGGHIVQGHVDGVGTVETFKREGQDYLLTVKVSDDVFEYVVHKGSITIDGVSLTVIDPKPDRTIRITIIPHTLERTTIGDYRPGTKVNLEADIIGKYVKHYLAARGDVPQRAGGL